MNNSEAASWASYDHLKQTKKVSSTRRSRIEPSAVRFPRDYFRVGAIDDAYHRSQRGTVGLDVALLVA